MFTLVVSRPGSTLPPLVYGPFDTEDAAKEEWESLEGMRSLFDDLLAHSVVPLQAASDHAPEPVIEPHVCPQPVVIYPAPHWNPNPPVWVWPNQPYPYRVTWGGSTITYGDGAITP